jgi:hypothetical protein
MGGNTFKLREKPKTFTKKMKFCIENKIHTTEIIYFDRLKYVNVKLELPSLNRKI